MKPLKWVAIVVTLFLNLFVSPAEGEEPVKDIEGNVYKTVKAGTQIWIAENLKVTRYRNGDAIPCIQEPGQWKEMVSGAYCDVLNDPGKSDSLGRLYNWYVVSDKRSVCPQGWHVPSEEEWQVMVKFLGSDAESEMLNKAIFTLLQSDFRGYDGEFLGNGYGGGGWWSSTPKTSSTSYYHGINYNTVTKTGMEGSNHFGYSIRCIKN